MGYFIESLGKVHNEIYLFVTHVIGGGGGGGVTYG